MNKDASKEKYRVVALRYRPADFDDLIGQSQVATALRNAIQQNRVGHAYLFTGARGVGKTSSARIFAKCLNCVEGPTITPCGKCDICESVPWVSSSLNGVGRMQEKAAGRRFNGAIRTGVVGR